MVHGSSVENAWSDAKKIAAAPEMEGALRYAPDPDRYRQGRGFDLDRFLTDYYYWYGTRCAALAKARGEG